MLIENFTPVTATLGGLLIGTSATLLLAFHGKIAGISGIAKGLLFHQENERRWRLFFVFGLILGGALMLFFLPHKTAQSLQAPPLQMALGGLLVGFGSAMGNGCTSGHGVCGLGRRSRRSLISVLTFMATGFITLFLMTHLLQMGRF